MNREALLRVVCAAYVLASVATLIAAFYVPAVGSSGNGSIAFGYYGALIADVPWTPLVFMVVTYFELTDEAFLWGSAICVAVNAVLLWGICFSARRLVFQRMAVLAFGLGIACLVLTLKPSH